jgi:hypothetical protein
MIPLRWSSHHPARWAVVLLLILAACDGVPLAPYSGTPGTPAALLAEAPRAIALTQPGNSNENQPAATAEIQRSNAQATLNAASSTLGAAQTQDQTAANAVAAQLAATAQIQRANAQATLVAAASTQNAAVTQDAIRQTQAADQATTGAEAVLVQQNANDMAAGTQTAVANGVATEARSAVATSQWYTDQARQRDEQRQVPIAFLWTWCWPAFLVLLAGLVVWGFWRWLRLRQAKQRMLNDLLEQLPSPPTRAQQSSPDVAPPYIEGAAARVPYQLTEPEDQVHRWLGEVKDKLQGSDQKDEHDDSDN